MTNLTQRLEAKAAQMESKGYKEMADLLREAVREIEKLEDAHLQLVLYHAVDPTQAKIYSKNEFERLKREQAKSHLEQQAEGIQWVLDCRELNLSDGEIYTLLDKRKTLRQQAKE